MISLGHLMFQHVDMSPSYLLVTNKEFAALKMKNDLRPVVSLISTSVGVMWDRDCSQLRDPLQAIRGEIEWSLSPSSVWLAESGDPSRMRCSIYDVEVTIIYCSSLSPVPSLALQVCCREISQEEIGGWDANNNKIRDSLVANRSVF